jgi:hypothetical protein
MDIKSFFGGSDMMNHIIENEKIFKNNEEKELDELRKKQVNERINNRNEQIKIHIQCLDELYEKNVVDMLETADFIYTGSNKQNKQTENFNNCYFPTVLKKMLSEGKLKFVKFNPCGCKPSAFYYNKLSDDEVNAMNREEIESRSLKSEKCP